MHPQQLAASFKISMLRARWGHSVEQVPQGKGKTRARDYFTALNWYTAGAMDFPSRAGKITSILSLLPALITKNVACETINWVIWAGKS